MDSIKWQLDAGGYRVFVSVFALLAVMLQGCTGLNTFPTVARQGDTVSVMVGGSEKARKDTISATLTDVDNVAWDLQSLGLVRSVFNLRPDGRAHGLHYAPWLDSEIAWLNAHDQVQTVLVFDVPAAAAIGQATLDVSLNVDDNSSGVIDPSIGIEIIAGTGSSDSFLRQNFTGPPVPVSFEGLEPAPHAKISFGDGSGGLGYTVIGAASLEIDFDETILNGDDISVFVPESFVRGSFSEAGAFGDKQRMVSWRQDGSKLTVHVIAPQGIEGRYLQIYVMHPRSLPGDPLLTMNSATFYVLDGNTIFPDQTIFTYYP